ncbi:MAG: hypothetical protein ACK4N5_13525, partial [Myxococcales bacterium]
MGPATAPLEIELLSLLRRLVGWPMPVLVAVGALLGVLFRSYGPATHSAAFGVTWADAACPDGGAPRRPSSSAIPAAMLEGHARFDTRAPAPVRDAVLRCTWPTASSGSTCELSAPSPQVASRLAEIARTRMREPASPVMVALAEARIVGACGFAALEALAGEPPIGPPPGGSLAQVNTAALDSARAQFSAVLELDAPRPPVPSPIGTRAPLLGGLLGLLAAVLLAAWRVRGARETDAPDVSPGPLASLAAAGLLLTPGMDRVMNVDVAGFTVRFGQLCALVLLGAVVVDRLRRRAPLVLPFLPVAAALGWLF